jgi:hypothetical protein
LTMETLGLRLVLPCRACRHDSNTTVRDLPSGRSYRGCTTLDDTVIICGGCNDVSLSDAHIHYPDNDSHSHIVAPRFLTPGHGLHQTVVATTASNWLSEDGAQRLVQPPRHGVLNRAFCRHGLHLWCPRQQLATGHPTPTMYQHSAQRLSAPSGRRIPSPRCTHSCPLTDGL